MQIFHKECAYFLRFFRSTGSFVIRHRRPLYGLSGVIFRFHRRARISCFLSVSLPSSYRLKSTFQSEDGWKVLRDCHFSPKSAGISPHRTLSQCLTSIVSIAADWVWRNTSALKRSADLRREPVRFSLNHAIAVRLSV